MNKPVYLKIETQSLQNGHSRGQILLSVVPQDMPLFGGAPEPMFTVKFDFEDFLTAMENSVNKAHGKVNATLCNS